VAVFKVIFAPATAALLKGRALHHRLEHSTTLVGAAERDHSDSRQVVLRQTPEIRCDGRIDLVNQTDERARWSSNRWALATPPQFTVPRRKITVPIQTARVTGKRSPRKFASSANSRIVR